MKSTKLLKSETVALWHAIQWMETCIDAGGTIDDEEWKPRERERLTEAKRALRKVNAIRKAQAKVSP